MTDFTANWHWPQWTFLIWMLIGLMANSIKHGEPYDLKRNAFVSFIKFVVVSAILVCGGFYR